MRAPSDANCAFHPGALAAAICSRCGTFVCATCAHGSNGQWFCANCTSSVPVRAGLGERFLANLLDHLVLLFPSLFVFALAFGIGAVSLSDLKHDGDDAAAGVLVLASMGIAFLFFAAGAAAQIWAQLAWGQSLGKRLMNIKVVRLNGTDVELWRLLLVRNLAPVVISQACGLFGLVDALFIFGAEQRCLHDLMSDTIVVHHPRTS